MKKTAAITSFTSPTPFSGLSVGVAEGDRNESLGNAGRLLSLPENAWSIVTARLAFGLGKRLAFAGAIIFIVMIANWYAPARPSLELRLAASLTLIVAAVPTWLWLTGMDQGVPFMPFFAMLYACYYAVPVFILSTYRIGGFGQWIPDASLAPAEWCALLALLMIYAGYYGPQRHLLASLTPKPRLVWTRTASVKLLAIAFSVIGIAGYAIGHHFALSAAQAAHYIGLLATVGILMLLSLYWTERLDRLTTIFLWALIIPVRVMLGFAAGETTAGFIVVLAIVVLYAAMRNRIPWKWLAAGFLALLIIRPMMVPMRALTWAGGPFANASKIEKAGLFIHFADMAIEGRLGRWQKLIDFSGNRLWTTMTLARVMRMSPRDVPYWGGASYYPILFKPIPRFLWPDKPQETTGQTFGHRYGFLDPTDNSTSYNLPEVVELYANFGMWGVILGGLIFGLYYRFFETMFFHPEMGWGCLVCGVFFLMTNFGMESATSLMVGGQFWALVFIYLINLCVDAGQLLHLTEEFPKRDADIVPNSPLSAD